MIKKLILITIFFFKTTPLFATQNAVFVIPSHDDLFKLSKAQQVLFLQAMREMFVEFESTQGKEGFGLEEKKQQASLFKLLLNQAMAIGAGDKCIHAGFLQTFVNIGPRLVCERPPSTGCNPSTYIQCNPLIFGEQVCAKPSQTISRNCDLNAKSLGAVIEELKKKKDKWDAFAQSMSEFCKSSRRWECSVIMGRMLELDKALGTKFTEKMKDKIWDDLPKSALDSAPDPQGQAPKTVKTSADSACQTRTKCSHISLLELVQVNPRYETEQLFSVDEILNLMCTRQPFNSEVFSPARQKIQRRQQMHRASTSGSNLYNSCYLSRLAQNIDLCQQQAEQLRKAPKFESPAKKGLIQGNQVFVGGILITDAQKSTLSRQLAFIELKMGQELNLCEFEYKPQSRLPVDLKTGGKPTK